MAWRLEVHAGLGGPAAAQHQKPAPTANATCQSRLILSRFRIHPDGVLLGLGHVAAQQPGLLDRLGRLCRSRRTVVSPWVTNPGRPLPARSRFTTKLSSLLAMSGSRAAASFRSAVVLLRLAKVALHLRHGLDGLVLEGLGHSPGCRTGPCLSPGRRRISALAPWSRRYPGRASGSFTSFPRLPLPVLILETMSLTSDEDLS